MAAQQGREAVVAVRLGNKEGNKGNKEQSKENKEKISLIIPVLNESHTLAPFLKTLSHIPHPQCEIIIVDGGSADNTLQIAKQYNSNVFECGAGRAKQMNLGAAEASGSILLFLHADTLLPANFFSLITDNLKKQNKSHGRFNVCLSGKQLMFRVIENLINVRSCLTGISTGDQAMFMKKNVFDALGGFPDIPLMEDVALSRLLKKYDLPLCLQARVVTSSRRWEKHGIWRTIFLMWRLRLAYFLGTNPIELKKKYG